MVIELPSDDEIMAFVNFWWSGIVTFDPASATTSPALDQIHPEHFADFARDVLNQWKTTQEHE